MIFNKSSGFLKLPTAGIYYTYYHLLLNHAEDNIMVRSRLVGCIPGQRCNFMSSRGRSTIYMQTGMDLDDLYSRGLSQGALFYFPAGTEIAVVVKDEPITYNDSGSYTYFGAFLVS